MGRRSPETMVKRAREQALREKRELKQAKKDARAAERLRQATEPEDGTPEESEDGTPEESEDGTPEETPEP